MKRDAELINIGRGAIVSLDDLVDALDRKVIAGAALMCSRSSRCRRITSVADAGRHSDAARGGLFGEDSGAASGDAARERPKIQPERSAAECGGQVDL